MWSTSCGSTTACALTRLPNSNWPVSKLASLETGRQAMNEIVAEAECVTGAVPPLDENQDFVWQSVQAEHQQDWAPCLLSSKYQVVKLSPKAGLGSLLWGFAQGNGRLRRIDNERTPKHDEATGYLEIVTMYTSFHLALMVDCSLRPWWR